MRPVARLILMAMLLALGPLVQAHGAEKSLSASERPRYLVGGDEQDLQPYSWVDAGEYRGAYRELLDAFAEYQHIEFVYLPSSYSRAVWLLREGRIDFVFPCDIPWAKKEKGDQTYLYSEPSPLRYQDGLFVLSGMLDQGKKLNRSITSMGILQGWTPLPYLAGIDAGRLRSNRYVDVLQMLEALVNGEVDALYMNRKVLEIYTNTDPAYAGVHFAEFEPTQVGGHRLATIEHGELIDAFNRFLIERADEIEVIRQRYRLP